MDFTSKYIQGLEEKLQLYKDIMLANDEKIHQLKQRYYQQLEQSNLLEVTSQSPTLNFKEENMSPKISTYSVPGVASSQDLGGVQNDDFEMELWTNMMEDTNPGSVKLLGKKKYLLIKEAIQQFLIDQLGTQASNCVKLDPRTGQLEECIPITLLSLFDEWFSDKISSGLLSDDYSPNPKQSNRKSTSSVSKAENATDLKITAYSVLLRQSFKNFRTSTIHRDATELFLMENNEESKLVKADSYLDYMQTKFNLKLVDSNITVDEISDSNQRSKRSSRTESEFDYNLDQMEKSNSTSKSSISKSKSTSSSEIDYVPSKKREKSSSTSSEPKSIKVSVQKRPKKAKIEYSDDELLTKIEVVQETYPDFYSMFPNSTELFYNNYLKQMNIKSKIPTGMIPKTTQEDFFQQFKVEFVKEDWTWLTKEQKISTTTISEQTIPIENLMHIQPTKSFYDIYPTKYSELQGLKSSCCIGMTMDLIGWRNMVTELDPNFFKTYSHVIQRYLLNGILQFLETELTPFGILSRVVFELDSCLLVYIPSFLKSQFGNWFRYHLNNLFVNFKMVELNWVIYSDDDGLDDVDDEDELESVIDDDDDNGLDGFTSHS
ncbi:hypothetical protein HDV02_004888 [Globomyces sp. JEL0801]|nr:hypothetical protein HDV02_004888 [Globomyces sp. JEL0801]